MYNSTNKVKSVVNLLFAAYTGDVSALRRFALSSMDLEQRDYDSRTALHVAAAEGHAEVVHFLLDACKVNPQPRDRHNRRFALTRLSPIVSRYVQSRHIFRGRDRCRWPRWGNTPLDEAVHFGHHEVATILQQYQEKYVAPASADVPGAEATQSPDKSLDSLL